jgi:outer membrane immunogenic protein
MKKTTSGLALVAALIATPTLAADLGRMPTKAPVYTPAPAPLLWNGFYIGAQVGYAWGDDHSEEFTTATGLATGADPSIDPDGVVGGIHLGYNYQMSSIVLGVEGDIEASGVDGSATNVFGVTTSFDNRWQGSLRGRLGAAFGPTLLYVTGGVAFADLRYRYSTAATPVESFSDTKAGWTLGAGAEFAFSPAWSTRLEYRYTDFGSITNTSLIGSPGFTYKHDPSFHTVRLGVSYHFY